MTTEIGIVIMRLVELAREIEVLQKEVKTINQNVSKLMKSHYPDFGIVEVNEE